MIVQHYICFHAKHNRVMLVRLMDHMQFALLQDPGWKMYAQWALCARYTVALGSHLNPIALIHYGVWCSVDQPALYL